VHPLQIESSGSTILGTPKPWQSSFVSNYALNGQVIIFTEVTKVEYKARKVNQ
jgi:hypothetical protein